MVVHVESSHSWGTRTRVGEILITGCQIPAVHVAHRPSSLTSHSAPKYAARGSEMVGASGGVGVHPLSEKGQILHCQQKRWVRPPQSRNQLLTRDLFLQDKSVPHLETIPQP